MIVRQSTAFETAIGPVLDGDGVAVTDCVVGDFKLKKTSGNFAALNASATLTHVSAGVYDLVLTTSDTDTVGVSAVAIDDTVNACPILYLQIVEEAIFDALFAASANGFAGAAGSSTVVFSNTSIATVTNVTNLHASAATAAELAKVPKSDSNVTWNATALASINTQADLALSDYDPPTRAELTSDISTVTALIGTPTDLGSGATLSFNLLDTISEGQAINLKIGAAGEGLTDLGGMSTTMRAQVQTEADDALVARNLDHLLQTAAVAGDVVNSSVIARLASKSATPNFSSFDNTTDAMEAQRDNVGTAGAGLTAIDLPDQTMNITGNITGNLSGSVGSVTANVNAVLANAAHGGVNANLTLGTVDTDSVSFNSVTVVNDFAVTGTISADSVSVASTIFAVTNAIPWNPAWDTEVQSEATDALNAYDPPTHAELTTALAAIWTTALTEAYRATGATGTGAQLLYEILQNLTEFAIASTTKTVKKLDGSTTAKTYTLDSATTPTSITEAT